MAGPNSFLQSPFQSLIDRKDDDTSLLGNDAVKDAPVPELQDAPVAKVEQPKSVAQRTAPSPASLLPPPEQRPLFEASAARYKVPVNVLMALVQQESSYNADAVNKESGAAGPAQYIDATAKALRINAKDPNEAVPAAAKQLAERLAKGYSVEDAVKEHFAGPNRRLWGDKTAAYGTEVLQKAGVIGQEMYGSDDATPSAPTAGPEQNQFAPNRMSRADYEKEFRALNPRANDAAVKVAMTQYDQQKTDARKATDVTTKKLGPQPLPTAEQFFDARLNQRLQGEPSGVEPQLPGRQQPINPDVSAPRKRPSLVDQAKGDFGRGIDNLKALGYGSAGLAADAAGKDDEATKYLDEYVSIQNDIAKNNPATIGTYKNVKSLGDAGRYAIEAVAENLPMILPSLVTGGVGAQAAKVGAQRLVGGMIEAQVAKGVAREVAERQAAQFVAKRILLGSAAGAAPASIGMESGSIMGDIYQDTGKKTAGTSLAFGIPAGLLDTIEPVMALRKIAGPAVDELAGGIIKRLGVEAGKQFLVEAGTEGLQTVLEEAAKTQVSGKPLFTQELVDQVIDSALKGGIGGGVMGGVSQGVAELKAAPQQEQAAPAPQQRIEPTLGEAPAPVAQPVEPSIQSPTEQATHQFQASDQGFSGQIMGDDGQMYAINSQTGVADEPLGPLEFAVKEAAAQHAADPAPVPVVQEAPVAPDYASMSPADLRAAMRDVAQRAKDNPQQRKELMAERKTIEKEISLRGEQAAADSRPASEPLTAGPFDDMKAANKMMERYAKETGEPHEVVKQNDQFVVQPIGAKTNGIDSAGAARGSDGHGRSSGPADVVGRPDGKTGDPTGRGTGGSERPAGAGVDDGRVQDAGADRANADGTANAQPALSELATAGSSQPYWKTNPFHAYQFPDQAKAEAFIDRKGADRNEFEAVQTGPVRWQVKPRAAPVSESFQSEQEAVADVSERPQVPEETPAPSSAESAPSQPTTNASDSSAEATGAKPVSEHANSIQREKESPSSWVIRNKETGEAVLETSDKSKVDALNNKKYEAVPILKHLQEINDSESKAAKYARRDTSESTKPSKSAKPKRTPHPRELLNEKQDEIVRQAAAKLDARKAEKAAKNTETPQPTADAESSAPIQDAESANSGTNRMSAAVPDLDAIHVRDERQEAEDKKGPEGEARRISSHKPVNLVRMTNAPDFDWNRSKPNGTYASIADDPEAFTSPFADDYKDGRRVDLKYTPRNPLEVGDLKVKHARFKGSAGSRGESSAGIKALHASIPQDQFDAALAMSKEEVQAEIAARFPDVDSSAAYDAYEAIEIWGAQEAKAKGHDIIIARDSEMAEFSEAVLLSGADGAKKSSESGAKFSVMDLPAAANQQAFDQTIQKLVDGGKIVLHDDASTLPGGKAPDGTQALTAPDGTIHIVKGASNAVVLHEAFHAGGQKLIGTKVWDGLMSRLGALYRQSEKSSGAARAFFDKARARVATAKAKGAVADGMEHEEFGAYAIEEYESAPATVRKWVDDLVGAVKAWALRRFGRQLGQVTPAQLSALAKAALEDVRAARAEPAFSADGAKTIEVNGERRSIENSKDQLIAPDMNKQLAFYRFFGDSKVVDDQGRPLVTYHGTASDIAEFDGRSKYEGGIYFTPNTRYATGRAGLAQKMGHGEAPNVMPVYLRVENPAPPGMSVPQAKDEGYDGVIRENEIVVFRPEQIKSTTGNNGNFDSDNADIRYSVSGSPQPRELTPPEQGLLRRLQGQIQDNLNRVKQVQERISDLTGVKNLAGADYYGAEANRPGRIASRKEDFQEKMLEPMLRRLAKAGHTPAQLSELLHAQHAEERNKAVAAINPEFPDGGSGLKTADANVIIDRYKNSPKLLALADEARQISRETLDLKLAYGLITKAQHESLSISYDNYVPLKGDGEYGPKVKRATGHGERDEHILENIARDYEQALVVGEKNLARQSLVQMILQYPDDSLWTLRVPPKGKYVAGTVFSISKVGTSDVEANFTSQSEVAAWLEAKGPAAAQYEVNASGGERVTEFTKPLQDNEVMVYIKGSPVRVQIHDEALARQLRPLRTEMMNTVLQLMQKHNRYLSAIFTGYNPAFIMKNATRDAMTGTINATGNHGIVTAAKAWAKYPAAWAAMLQFAATGKEPQGGINDAMGWHLKAYRDQGGKVGASYMSDLEAQGKSLQRMFDDAKGAINYAKEGKIDRAALIAGRKAIGGLAHAVEIVNQAFENAFRLALFAQLRDEGKAPAIAAQAAKNVTVNFDRKGTATPYLGAFYLFLNPAVQGTANLTKTLAKGEHKYQAWALTGMMAAAGFAAAIYGMDDDKDRWLGEKWDTRTKNLRIRIGSHTINIPLSQEYAPFYSIGVAMGEASRGESSLRSAAHVLSSFLDAYYPMQGAVQPGSDNYALDLLLAHVPTVGKVPAQIATNRNSFGNQVVPETDTTKTRPDNLKMNRGTKNSGYDAAAQGISKAGEALGADKYQNDLSKVSPETLKLIYATYTGGLGRFIADSAGFGAAKVRGDEGLDSSDIPIIKDFVKPDSMNPIRTRYFNLADSAKDAISQFEQAKKQRDGAEMRAIAGDPEKRALLGLSKMIQSTNKVQGIFADQAVSINADKTLTLGQKREQLKAIEDRQEEIYRKGIAAFKK